MATTQEKLGNDVEGRSLTDGMNRTVRDGLQSAKEHIVDGYEKVSEKAHEAWDKAADTTVHDVQRSVQLYIRRHPGTSLMMAAGAGMILGLLLRRHRH